MVSRGYRACRALSARFGGCVPFTDTCSSRSTAQLDSCPWYASATAHVSSARPWAFRVFPRFCSFKRCGGGERSCRCPLGHVSQCFRTCTSFNATRQVFSGTSLEKRKYSICMTSSPEPRAAGGTCQNTGKGGVVCPAVPPGGLGQEAKQGARRPRGTGQAGVGRGEGHEPRLNLGRRPRRQPEPCVCSVSSSQE